MEMGFRAVRAQSPCPAWKTYGISGGGKAYEPAESAAAGDAVGHAAVPAPRAGLFERLRVDHGNDVELLHDAHHRLTPIEAARLARDLEPYQAVLAGGCNACRESAGVRVDPAAFRHAARGR